MTSALILILENKRTGILIATLGAVVLHCIKIALYFQSSTDLDIGAENPETERFLGFSLSKTYCILFKKVLRFENHSSTTSIFLRRESR